MSYTFSLSRRSIPVRCLCLLLAVLVLWCFFMVPRAGAVATEAATVAYAGALIGTILVGAGVMFSSHGDMQAVGAAMYKSWIKSSNAIGSTISAIASWALEHGEAVAKGALRVGKDMYQAVVDAFNASYADGAFSCGSYSVVLNNEFFSDYNSKEFWSRKFTSAKFRVGSGVISVVASLNGLDFKTMYFPADGDMQVSEYKIPPSNDSLFSTRWPAIWVERYFDGSIHVYSSLVSLYYGDTRLVKNDVFSLGSANDISATFGYSVAIPAPDLAYPSDNTLVRMPDIPSVDTATGTVTFPSDAAYTKDAVAVPYPVDTEGVKVPDIPYDKVVDQSTGKTLDDADTGTDTKPGEGTGEGTETGSGVSGLIGTIIGLLKNFFDSPSDFKLDMDGFRNLAIADKFPFCIPFDMVDSVKQFAATAADYQFRIKFDTQYFSVDHTVDLTPIAVPLAFFRYIVCVWFVWVLMSRTHDLMKW